jgi:hypothetical protein
LTQVELNEVLAATIGVEPAEKHVVVFAVDRIRTVSDVARHTNRNGAVPADQPRAVLGRPGIGIVAIVEPGRHDRRASFHRAVPGVVAVLGVLAEELTDRLRLIARPRSDIVVEPQLESRGVHPCNPTPAAAPPARQQVWATT